MCTMAPRDRLEEDLSSSHRLVSKPPEPGMVVLVLVAIPQCYCNGCKALNIKLVLQSQWSFHVLIIHYLRHMIYIHWGLIDSVGTNMLVSCYFSKRRGPVSSQHGRGVPGYWDKSAVPETGYKVCLFFCPCSLLSVAKGEISCPTRYRLFLSLTTDWPVSWECEDLLLQLLKYYKYYNMLLCLKLAKFFFH